MSEPVKPLLELLAELEPDATETPLISWRLNVDATTRALVAKVEELQAEFLRDKHKHGRNEVTGIGDCTCPECLQGVVFEKCAAKLDPLLTMLRGERKEQ